MEIVKEFSRFAYEYDKYNVIQKEVAKRLISLVEKKNYNKILDLGAGDGAIYRNLIAQEIQFCKFVAFDFSEEMLSIHPENKSIKKVCHNFNMPNAFDDFKNNEFDLLISSSALQWSDNLFSVLSSISQLSSQFYFSFFTSNTFRTLHQTANIDSPIYSRRYLMNTLDKLFDYESETVLYKLHFPSVHEMLRYIKRSGVGGGVKQLSYKQTKDLISKYSLDYLEFEVIFIKVISKI